MKLFVFGLGYSALNSVNSLAPVCIEAGGWVAATTRSSQKLTEIRDAGVRGHIFDGDNPGDEALIKDLQSATHILVSIAPQTDPLGRDLVLAHHGDDIIKSEALRWIGYYSTVGVYGDHDGAWVDEETDLKPVSVRSRARVKAEADWTAFANKINVPLAIMRLAGIYGPGRNTFVNFREGRARRIIKPGQVFNRIHVDDIAQITLATAQLQKGGLFNGSDNEPAPPQDVVEFAANLMNVPVPPDIPFDEANLSPMGRSFYGETKRVSNEKLRRDLEIILKYPTYREALIKLWQDELWDKRPALKVIS